MKLLIILLILALVLGSVVPVAAKAPASAQDGKAWGHDKNPDKCRGSFHSAFRGQHTYRPECYR